MSITEQKGIVIKHVFTDVMNMESNTKYYGNKENHFNILWQISLERLRNGSCVIDSHISTYDGTGDLSIDAETEIKLISIAGETLCEKRSYRAGINDNRFKFSSAQLEKFMLDGTLTVEMHVLIVKLNGVKLKAISKKLNESKGKLRNFDEPIKEFSDIVLKVKDEKFYVLKTYLAVHSSYFQSLFFGNFDESEKSEIELKDIEPCDFQNFLEVLYAEPAINDDTVDGIFRLADMYDSKTAIRRCEEFLVQNSEKPLKMKFETAIKYKMDKLKVKCLSEMRSKYDVLSVLPKDPNQIEPVVWEELVRKIASFS